MLVTTRTKKASERKTIGTETKSQQSLELELLMSCEMDEDRQLDDGLMM